MEINKKWLEGKRACSEGVEWFLAQKETNGVKVVNALIVDKKLEWANWTIVRLMTHPQQIQYAIYAAELVINIFEEKYPDDKRPRLAIETAKEYIKNPSAYAAANAAYYAAYAAANIRINILNYGLKLL